MNGKTYTLMIYITKPICLKDVQKIRRNVQKLTNLFERQKS